MWKKIALWVLLAGMVALLASHAEDGTWQDAPVASAAISCGGDEAVLQNVEIAAGSVYDATLATGDTFSFNAVVGPRDSQYGYVDAADGTGATVAGGGADLVASAVWLAVRDMEDVAIVEKSTYGVDYNQSYVDSSDNAILTDPDADVDFAFRYDGPGFVTLYTYLDGNTLRCEIYRSA